MKLMDLSDIPEINKENVYIANKAVLLEKLNKIISGGPSKLQIVTDFDHTLTRHKMDNGKAVLTSFGMFRECPSIPQRYKDEDVRLAAIYKPIEASPVMPTQEKIKHMIDWYTAAHSLLKGIKFPRDELMESCSKMVECFRIGVQEMISWSEAQKVPVLVFSAGLGEAVVCALRAAHLLQPHVKVVSNFLAMDANDTIVGIKGEVIHTYNKKEAGIADREYRALAAARAHVLLLGDNVGDARMADGLPAAVVLRVAFLAHDARSLPEYLANFDLVLLDDHSLDVVNAILKLVL